MLLSIQMMDSMARDKPFQIRTTAEWLARVDEWCNKQVPSVSRAHAIHVAMDFFLAAETAKERKQAQIEQSLELLYQKGLLKRPRRQKGKKR